MPAQSRQRPLLINAPTSLANLAQLGGFTFLPVPGQSIERPTGSNEIATSSTATNLSIKLPKPIKPPVIKLAKGQSNQNYNLTSIQLSHLIANESLSSMGMSEEPMDNYLPIDATTSKSSRTSKQTPSSVSHKVTQRFNKAVQQPKGPQRQIPNSVSSATTSRSMSGTSSKISKAAVKTNKKSVSKTNSVGSSSNVALDQLAAFSAIRYEQSHTDLDFLNSVSPETNDIHGDEFMVDDIYKTTSQSMVSRDHMDSTDIETSGFSSIDASVNEDDANNISLIKLMAILNNPALTITAVNSEESRNSHSTGLSQNHLQPNATYPDQYQHNQNVSKMNTSDNNQQMSINLLQAAQMVQAKPISGQQSRKTSSLNPHQSSSKPVARQTQVTAPIDSPHASSCQSFSSISAASISLDPNPKRFGQISGQKGFESYPSVARGLTKMSQLLQSNHLLSEKRHLDDTPTANVWPSTNTKMEKSNDPTLMSTSVRNLMMQELPTSSNKQQSFSVQLLRHIANQSQLDDAWSSPVDVASNATNEDEEKSILEPECILSVPRSVPPFITAAKKTENVFLVSSCPQDKLIKDTYRLHKTSKHRMYIPISHEDGNHVKANKPTNYIESMKTINVDEVLGQQVYVSEKHFMLDSMSATDIQRKKVLLSDPDEIFVNRSKRVMSRIDTMVERKRRRRFERITSRYTPKTSSLEDQAAESDDEWSLDEQNMEINEHPIIKTQLPLEEPFSEDKRNFMSSVGLVTRDERNKILVHQCEQKFKLSSPLVREVATEVSPEIKRFVDMMLKTDGKDVQLRTDTSIKRNDLPLIEGLNRNTSRVKMNYMNMLGLEKRSKRTTLYKVKSGSDNTNTAISKSIDLNKNSTSAEKSTAAEQEVAKNLLLIHSRSMTNQQIIMPTLSTYCRGTMEPPSKNEYMKSLGLMAS